MKASSITVDGKERAVFKEPITDPGKASKAGRLDLIQNNGSYQTIVLKHGELAHVASVMQTVFKNGEVLVDDTLDNIRTRAKSNA